MLSCGSGLTDCGGLCRDLAIDEMNCGACGNLCGSGETCVSGTCMIVCAPGQTLCGTTCTNTDNDPANCGACGTACSASEACVMGSCTPLVTCMDVETFDTGTWPWTPWNVVAAGGTVDAAYAHDGARGIRNPGWHYRTDVSVGVGTRISLWVRGGTGRFYLGFDATAAGAKSFVVAFNTSDIRFQTNNSYTYTELTTVSQTFTAGRWYRMEVEIMSGGIAVGRVYDQDGETLLNSVTHNYGSIGSGGLAIRSFLDVDGDTLEFCP
jgi:hypothetical protein